MNKKNINRFYIGAFLMGFGLMSMAEAHESCGASAADGDSSAACGGNDSSVPAAQMGAQVAPRPQPAPAAVCSGERDCNDKLRIAQSERSQADLRIQAIQAALQAIRYGTVLGVGEIERNDDAQHTVHYMDWEQANRYCHDVRNSRLPRPREFALYAQNQRACGILSPSEYNSFQGTPRCGRDYYRHVVVEASSEGPADEFYFSRQGYLPQAEASGNNNWFWSSSGVPGFSNNAYAFDGDLGYFYNDGVRDDGVAVRCAR